MHLPLPAKDVLLAYLTVVECDSIGAIGGCLVVDRAGRPREFHCTAPVAATRTQEILYGATLRPFLYGEQIGLTLLAKCRGPVGLVITDVPEITTAHTLMQSPIALLEQADEENDTNPSDMTSKAGDSLNVIRGGDATLSIVGGPAGLAELKKIVQDCAARFDLAEPLERIRLAIRETSAAA